MRALPSASVPRRFHLTRAWIAFASLCGVAACDSPLRPAATSYTLGGAVARLAGSGLVLVNNGGDSLAVSADGPVTFRRVLTRGAEYRVTVLTQPANPQQTCVVSDGSGTVTTADITTVTVACFMAGSASPFLVSSPVPNSSATRSGGVTSQLTPVLVYVSLPPGAIPNGASAAIRNLRTGVDVAATVVGGGFDPVALPASEGDSIVIAVREMGSAGSTTFLTVVAASTRPTVVRTSPPRHKRDVSLNSILVIVFSEPLNPATVDTGSVRLWRGTIPVAGTVRFADAAQLRVEFHPDSLLALQADYQLVVSTAILDLNGLALDSAITIPFTSGTTVPPTNLVFASVSVGFFHSCGVTIAGAAYCWGSNIAGMLGAGTMTSSTTPVPVTDGLTFAMVSAGAYHTCGVTTTGAAYCWGVGGVLGDTIGSFSNTPRAVAGGLTFSSVSAGIQHTCGLTTTGTAYCWGGGGEALGRGTANYNGTPVPVAGGLIFVTVSVGQSHSCGVTTTGTAHCWGQNTLGELGIGTSTGPERCGNGGLDTLACSTVPVPVAGGLTFATVSASGNGTCARTTSGVPYCWGNNRIGLLGRDPTTGPEQCEFVLWSDWIPSGVPFSCSRVPVGVPGGLNLASLSAMDQDLGACGLTSAGVAYCWGAITSGDSANAPVVVPGGHTFASLSAGSGSTCGVTPDGVAYCWGANLYGQLGNGTTSPSSVPVKVAGQP